MTKFNVLAMSGKAVEAAGDINTIILDKTGTITFGNRMAHTLLPVGNETIEQVGKWAAISSVLDETPEGRSVIGMCRRNLYHIIENLRNKASSFHLKQKRE